MTFDESILAGQWARLSSPALVTGEVATGEVASPAVFTGEVTGEASECPFSNPDPALSARTTHVPPAPTDLPSAVSVPPMYAATRPHPPPSLCHPPTPSCRPPLPAIRAHLPSASHPHPP